MKNKNKKGFTLVELLAVIVVLAIIALIAVPIVLNIIEKSREGAAIASARSYIKAVETYIVMSDLDKEKESLEAGKTYLTSELDDKVELKGTKPESGNVTISNKNSVASATLVINGYTINYNGLDESYIINNGNTNNGNTGGNCDNSAMFVMTLKEQYMALELEKSTDWLKEFVDKALNEIFKNTESITKVEMEEIIKLQSGAYTWSSKDTDIITINGSKVTPKKIGTAIVVATTDKGAEIRIPLKVSETVDLSENVAVGDYVDYDAGEWTSSASLPTGHGQFGGYTAGNNKANSVSVCQSGWRSTSLKGWRVLNVNKDTNTVTIIHAGQPECYYHAYGYEDASVTNLNNRATSEYLNDTYATSAHMMNSGEADDYASLKITGTYYWLASPYNNNYLYRVGYDGGIDATYGYSWGIRPVVVLKPNIKTTGKTTDKVGQEAWSLVAP